MSAHTLANAAARVAALTLSRDREVLHQCFRVKNLNADEAVRFVEAWPDVAASTGLTEVRLLVADSLGGRVAQQYVAEAHHSITHYRNNNLKGMVYVETSTQSDEQGLQNMFSLRDSNFLDKSFDDYAARHGGVAGILVEEAWSEEGGTGALPDLLRSRLLEVIDLVHPVIEPVPVRRFVAFAKLACREWMSSSRALDMARADRIIGTAIWALDMFPDTEWNADGGAPRARRRLETNLRHAELMDGSSELDAEAITRRAESTRFTAQSGQPLQNSENEAWKQICIRYARAPNAETRKLIPYFIFAQLFKKDTSGLRLGDKVRAEIESADSARVRELDELDVVGGLNLRSSQDAARFLEAPPASGRSSLPDLLSAATRKAVERAAVPARRRFFNPAILVVRLIQRVRNETEVGRTIARIEFMPGPDAIIGSPTHGLFVFLFGQTLRGIAERMSDVPGACQLFVDNRLVTSIAPPPLVDQLTDDDDDPVEVSWETFPLQLRVLDAHGAVLEIEDKIGWLPTEFNHLALFWLLCSDPDSPAFQTVGTLRISPPPEGTDWLAPVIRRTVSLDAFRPPHNGVQAAPHPLIAELLALRQELAESLSARGLAVASLQSFLDAWNVILERARNEFVPDGVRGPALEAFLAGDLLRIEGSDRRTMLATHPIRLRWISAYLAETQNLAAIFLSGDAAFADGEGQLYLDWLEDLTPRESPPFVFSVENNGQLLYSRSESGWTEEFAALESSGSDSGTDSAAVESIARRIVGYLDAHPYKRDGLSMLVVLPRSDAMPAELLSRIGRLARGVRVSLHVAVPRERWEAIAREIEQLADSAGRTAGSRLFPDRDLSLLDYRSGADLEGLLSGLDLDIAIVTHVLQEQVVSQQNTEPPLERPGVNDPLRHRPLRLESGSDGNSISLVMLPRDPDRVLESWSTLVVRANRSRPVAPSQPENTDLVELRVNFQDSARLFRTLHHSCHWVITLERHISREQIESVEAGSPDVLSIEDRIGSNALSTLVVSSRSGRDLIQSRIARKLERLVPLSQRTDVNPTLMLNLAAEIYDSARQLAPRLALQALGVARVTEEIVGLTVARKLVEAHFPDNTTDGVSAWISLDEHTAWFGGHMQIRADLCRLSIARNSANQLVVDVLVLEGKLRQHYDGHGVLQVSRTCDFFRAVLGSAGPDGIQMIDAAMWRDRLASAIETLSPDAVSVMATGNADPGTQSQFRAELMSEFRARPAILRHVQGVYSACLWESEDTKLEKVDDGGIAVFRSTRFHLLDLVARISHRAPTPVMSIGPSAVDTTAVTPEACAAPPLFQTVSDPQCSVQVVAAAEADATSVPAASGSASRQLADVLPVAVSGPDPEATAASASNVEAVASSGARRSSAGMSDTELRRIYEKVLYCFGTHGIKVFAAEPEDLPYVEGPASILFKVRPGTGIDPRKLSEKGAALKLELGLEQEQNVSFNIDRGFVTIDVPKQPAQRYFVNAADMWSRWTRPARSLSVPVGEDRFGDLVCLDFSSSNSPHLLVAGTTGSGKSEALNTILFGLVQHYSSEELRLLLVDPKGTELEPFNGSAFLEGPIGWDDSDALALLRKAVEEMQRRYVLFRESRHRSLAEFNAAAADGAALPWWLIVLDEYADLTHDPQAKKDVEAELKRLAQKARAAGIHVVIATQKPSAEVISTNLRSNLPVQLALRVKSATESRVVIDEAGAENLNGKGDALLKADGRLSRIQCGRVDPASFDRILGRTEGKMVQG